MNVEVNKKIDVDVKRIKTNIKVGDRFTASVIDVEGKSISEIEDQYVPDFFPGQHWGDYLELDIDIETGQILNWVKPTAQQLSEMIDGPVDD